MELLVIRHGESVNNTLPAERHIPDPALTALGRRQADLLAARLDAYRPQAVVCSPLERALQTARPLVERCGAPWLVWAVAAEAHRAHPGDGAAPADLRARYPGARLEPGIAWPGTPGPETPAQAAARAAALLRRLRSQFAGALRVALVGHAGINGYLLRACLGTTGDGAPGVESDNASLGRLAFDPDGRIRILGWNDVRHLS